MAWSMCSFAIEMGKLGGLAVLNLEGVQTRYKNPEEVLQKIVEADKAEITALLQKIYQEPVQEDLIAARIREIKDAGVPAAVSSIPQRAERFGAIAQEAGADIFVVQSTVSTVRHISSEYKSLDLAKFCRDMRIPVIVGNTVGYDATFEIMECGPAAVLDRRRTGRGLHLARRARPGRAAGHRDGRLRRGARRLFQENRALRSHHHRRRNEQGRRRLQSARLRRGRRHGRKRVCQGARSARARLSLGHGHAARQSAARHADQSRRDRFAQADPLRPGGSGRRQPESGRRHHHLHGQRRRQLHLPEFQQTEIIIAPSIKTEGKLFQTVQSVGMGTR